MNCTFWPVACCEQDAGHLRRRVLVDERDLAGVRLHPGDEVLEVVRRQPFLGDHQLRIDGQETDRVEILLQVVVQFVDDAADMSVPLPDVDGVAVRLRACDTPDCNAAAGAADVLDHHRLAEMRAHAVGHDARNRVGRSAGRERHDQRDLARWKGLLRVDAGNGGAGEKHSRDGDPQHSHPPNFLSANWWDDSPPHDGQ